MTQLYIWKLENLKILPISPARPRDFDSYIVHHGFEECRGKTVLFDLTTDIILLRGVHLSEPTPGVLSWSVGINGFAGIFGSAYRHNLWADIYRSLSSDHAGYCVINRMINRNSRLIWTAYLWNCMSHDQHNLKVTYLRNIWIFEVIFVVLYWWRIQSNLYIKGTQGSRKMYP